MSSLSGLFRNITKSVPKSPAKTAADALYNERDLKTVVENFKKLSESAQFRRRHSYYGKTVKRLASAKKFSWVEEILEEQKKYGDMSKEGFSVRLISLYGKSGMFGHASKVFEEMPERKCPQTVMSFNALLGACVSAKEFDKAEELLRKLPEKLSLKPNVVSYNIVIKALCEMGSLDSAVSLFDEIEKNGVEPDVVTFNSLLYGLYQKGRFHDGEKLWAEMMETNVSPDIRTYNARLFGLVSEKKMAEAVQLFGELGSNDVKPDEFTYHHFIKGYCSQGDLEEAKRWYAELMKSDCAPNKVTFATLITFACQTADLDWAFELSKEALLQKCLVNAKTLQLVVDELVKESRIKEAKKLVSVANSNKLKSYRLIMNSDE